MKTKSFVRSSAVAAVLSGTAFFVPASSDAAALTWNPATNLAGASDGAGVWTSLETNWWDGAAATNWSSANPDNATFGAGGAAGIVTLGEPISVSNLTFGPVSAGNYQITGNTLTLANPSQVTGTSATISSALAGSSLTKAGNGTLTLSGVNTYAGATTVSGGTLVLSGTSFTYVGGGVAINGASTLRVTGTRYDFSGKTFTFDGTGGGTIDAIASGAGGFVFTGNNTFTTLGGAQNIMSGTLVGTGNQGFNLNGNSAIFNVAPGTNPGGDLNVTATLWNNGGLLKNGAGTLVLGANNPAKGNAVVGQGQLVITNGAWNGPVVISNGATVRAIGGAGLLGAYYNIAPPNPHPNFATLPLLNQLLAPVNPNLLFGSAGAGANFDFGGGGLNFPPGYTAGAANFQARWIGKYSAPTAGTYVFATASDDGSMIWIDGTNVVNNNFSQGVTARSNSVGLAAGLHDIVIGFYQGGGGYGMMASNTIPGSYTGLLQNALLSSGPGIGSLSGEAGGVLEVSNGLLTVAQSTAGAFSGDIIGNGGLFKIGTAALTLNGSVTHADSAVVGAGALVVNSTSFASPVLVQVAGTLAGTGRLNNVTAQAGGLIQPGAVGGVGLLTVTNVLAEAAGATNVFDFTAATNDILAVPGTLQANGATVALYPQAALVNGSYLIGTYGTLGGVFNTTVRNLNAATGGTKRLTLNYATPNQIRLTVADVQSLKWSGAVNGTWDVNTTTNWLNGTPAPDVFITGDSVLFDDTAVGNFTVTTFQSLEPSVVVVSNNVNAYTITGTNPLANVAGGLWKYGTNSLTLSTPGSSFTGPVVVAAGRIIIGATGAGSFGLTTGVTIQAGAQVNLNGVTQAANNYMYRIAGSGPDGRGAIFNTNANIGTSSTVKWLHLTADASIGSSGMTTLDNARFDVGFNGGIQGGGFTLTKVGNNVIPMRGSATNLQTIIAEGLVYVETVNDALGTNAIVQAGAYLGAYGARTIPTPITLNGGTLCSRGAAGACTWTGPVSVPVNSFISTLPPVYAIPTEAINVNGSISGAGGLTIYGNNTTTFRGTNTYLGPTIVNNAGGTLSLSTVGGNSIVSPLVQLGHLADGGGAAIVQANVNNQFGPNVNMTFGGSPSDWTALKLMGTEQSVQTINSDDNGGGILESTEAEAGVTTDGVLNITGSGNSYWSGSYLRDRAGGTSTSKLRINKTGSGTLTLATGNSPSPLYSGGLIVSNGTVNLKAGTAAGVAPVTLAGGTLALDGFGLAEGSVVTGGAIGTTNVNPVNTGVKLSTPRANRTTDFGGNTTWIYSGYMVITGAVPRTFTFAENVDDVSWLQIDGVQVLNNGNYDVPTLGSISLAPGLHRFDARFYNGGGGAGPVNSSWWNDISLGFGMDPLGRGQAVRTNYQAVADPGDGSLFLTQVVLTNDVVLTANANLKVSNRIGPTNSISGGITESGGSYGLTKIGAGALALNGVVNQSGSITVGGGTLFVNYLSAGTGAFTVQSNAMLSGTGTVNAATVTVENGGGIGERRDGLVGTLALIQNLTLNSGARVACQLNGAVPTINVGGALTTTAQNPVEIFSSIGPVVVGTYALIDYAGSIGGAGDAAFVIAGAMPNGAQGYITNNLGTTMIELVITNAGSGIRWIGSANNLWDIGNSMNWNTIGGGIPTVFNTGDAVLFDDLATGNFTNFISSAVRPGSVTVSNNAVTYAFTGAFGITGTAALVKQGSGSLTISAAGNTYTGGTTVNGGSIVIGATRAFGFTTGITVNAGGQVNFNGFQQIGVSYNWVVAGDGPGGSGAIYNTNGAIYLYSTISNLTLAGNSTIAIHGPGTSDAGRTDLCAGGTLNGNGFQITKTGLSQLNFRGITTGLTNILVTQGTVIGENASESLGANVWVASGAQVAGYGGVTNGATIQLNGGTLSTWGGAPSTWNGAITLLTNSLINNNPNVAGYGNVDVIVNGRIRGPGGFTKLGAQAAVLTAANDFGGPVVVNAGTLLLSGANTYSNSTTVQNGGTLRITNGNDRLPVTTALTVNGSDTVASLFDLNSLNQQIASLSGTNTYGATVSLGGGTLTISGTGGDYFGKITGSGALVRAGAGTQTLSASNTFTGGTTINSGTMKVRHHESLGQGVVTLNGGVLSLDASGLWEGRVNGAFNTTNANPKWAANLTTEKANSVVNTVYPDNTTYIYSGWLNITGNSPVTWSFVKRFDDSGLLVIDGVTLINQTGWDQTIVATTTLFPGTHRFEVRMGEGVGGIGPTGGWPFGFGVDKLGRNQATITNFVQLSDVGDGLLYFRDDLNFTNALVVSANSFINAPLSNTIVTLSSAISGAATLTKTGPGILVTTGTNALTSGMEVDGGALFVNGAHLGLGLAVVYSNSQIWGRGTIAGYVVVDPGATIGARIGVTNAGVTLTMGSLQLNPGAIVGGFINGTNPTISVTNNGAFSVTDSNLISIVTQGPLAVGTYPLIAYNTSISFSGFAGLYLGTLPNGAQGYLNNNLSTFMVELVVTNAGGGLRWYGSTGSGTWDVNTTPHWSTVPGAVSTLFQQFDAVRFDDTATNFNVTIATPVISTALAVSNDAQNFVFSGFFPISGTAGLTKDGAAKITISNVNTFTGPTRINSGTVSAVADGSLGAVPLIANATQLTVNAGATFEAAASFTLAGNRGIVIGPTTGSGSANISAATGANLTINNVIANRTGGTSALVKTGPGTLTVSAANTYSGGTTVDQGILASAKPGAQIGPFLPGTPVTVNAAGTLQFNNGDAFGYLTGAPSALTINGGLVTALGGGIRVTLLGGGLLTFNGGTLTSATNNTGDGNGSYLLNGNITANSNTATAVISPAAGMSLNLPNTTITVARGTNTADLLISGRLLNWPNVLAGFTKEGAGILQLTASNNINGGPTVVNAGTLLVGNGISGSLGTNSGAITVNGTLIYNLPGTTTVANVIGGSGTLVQAGPGRLVLSNANTLSGPAIVSNGTLIVSAAGSIAGNAEVRSGATLGGGGSINGAVTSDGTLAPGTSPGQLIIAGTYNQNSGATLAIEIGGAATAGTDYDQLVAGGTATLGGALNVTLINAYTPAYGDTFQILFSSTVSGTFLTTNLPALVATNVWNVEYTASAVTLSITSAPSATPTGYNAWSSLYVLTQGPEGDDDADGYANLLEYVTGANPTNADNLARMTATRTNNLLALRFTRTTNSVDATLIVEGANATTNNATWTGFATNIAGSWGSSTNVTETGGPALWNVTVPDTSPTNTRFLRLHVTRP